MTTTASGVEGQYPRRGSTSSATAASVETSRESNGRQWERQWAGMRADADTCRSLSLFPLKNATKWWWTSWQLLRSGCSCPNEDGAVWTGLRAWGSGAALAGTGLYFSLSFLLSFFHSVSLSSFIFHLSAGTKGSRGGAPPSGPLARRRRGCSVSCHTLIRVDTVRLNNNNNGGCGKLNKSTACSICTMLSSKSLLPTSIGTRWLYGMPFRWDWLTWWRTPSMIPICPRNFPRLWLFARNGTTQFNTEEQGRLHRIEGEGQVLPPPQSHLLPRRTPQELLLEQSLDT